MYNSHLRKQPELVMQHLSVLIVDLLSFLNQKFRVNFCNSFISIAVFFDTIILPIVNP